MSGTLIHLLIFILTVAMCRLHWKAREFATEDHTGFESRVGFEGRDTDGDQVLRHASDNQSIKHLLKSNSIGRRLRRRSPDLRSNYWWPQEHTESSSSSSGARVGARSSGENIGSQGRKATEETHGTYSGAVGTFKTRRDENASPDTTVDDAKASTADIDVGFGVMHDMQKRRWLGGIDLHGDRALLDFNEPNQSGQSKRSDDGLETSDDQDHLNWYGNHD